jgi:hypothetical protein
VHLADTDDRENCGGDFQSNFKCDMLLPRQGHRTSRFKARQYNVRRNTRDEVELSDQVD